MSGCTVAIDLGGTHVRAAVVDSDGSVGRRVRHPTPTGDPRPDILPRLVAEVAEGMAAERAVVGIPGIIDHESEALVHAPNLPPAWASYLTGDWLEQATGIPVSLANDADLAAVGEATFGAGRRHHDVVYVTISTGVGGGMVVGDRLVRGSHSGGEIGHTVVDIEAARAGRPATVEELGSGPAIAAAAAAAGLVERDEALADLVREGHPAATALWQRAIEVVGFGIVNMAWLITPQIVVVGGGVGNNSELVLPIIDEVLTGWGPALDEPIEVAAAVLGDDVALAGAAAWFAAIGRQERGMVG